MLKRVHNSLSSENDNGLNSKESKSHNSDEKLTNSGLPKCGKVLNKKRIYANYSQVNLIFYCSLVKDSGSRMLSAMKTMRESTSHFTRITPMEFLLRCNERVIKLPFLENRQVILVQGDDPHARQNQIQDVIKMMEMELGDGWILHKNCKVGNLAFGLPTPRVSGCLVAESIKKAYKISSSSVIRKRGTVSPKETRSSVSLQFGNVCFEREIIRRDSSSVEQEKSIGGKNKAIPAVGGIRAIWVAPSSGRKGIATNLLDAPGKNFCTGVTLEHTQIAFSQPTSVGEVLSWSTQQADMMNQDDGFAVLPDWMMENLGLQGDNLMVESVRLLSGEYILLQPYSTKFIELSNP